jgi:hypothetical protein
VGVVARIVPLPYSPVEEILIIFDTSHLSSAVVHFLEKPANAADTVAQLCNSPVSGGIFLHYKLHYCLPE